MPDTHPLWRNPWQVVRFHQGAVAVLCSHRHEWTARACTAWRDLRTDVGNVGKPVRIWHDYRRTPPFGYAPGGRIR